MERLLEVASERSKGAVFGNKVIELVVSPYMKCMRALV